MACCARRPQSIAAAFARDVLLREAADPLLDQAAARLSVPLAQPLAPVAPGDANGKRVATPRTPRRQAGWRPVTGGLLARHDLPGERVKIRRLRGFQEGAGAQGGLRLPKQNRAGSELDVGWGRQARTSPAWPPLGTRMCTVLRLIAGVDALRLRSGLVSNAAQEEVGFIA